MKKRIVFEPLRRASELNDLASKDVVSAEWLDDRNKMFEVVFKLGHAQRKSLLVDFYNRQPHLFISNIFDEEVCDNGRA